MDPILVPNSHRKRNSNRCWFRVANVLPLLYCYCCYVFVVVVDGNGNGNNGGMVGGLSAIGDPGMTSDGLRVAFEAWNFCNEVGSETPGMGSPRAADCFDLHPSPPSEAAAAAADDDAGEGVRVKHRVSEAVNKLGVGNPFPGLTKTALNNPDLYAVQKELYLGSLCSSSTTSSSAVLEEEEEDSTSTSTSIQKQQQQQPWQFWMVMLKNGNYDTRSGLCPENGKRVPPFNPTGRFPCFGSGCMNQPLFFHRPTTTLSSSSNNPNPNPNGGNRSTMSMRGGFSGTYDLSSGGRGGGDVKEGNNSYFEVIWEKRVGIGGWIFRHKLRTSISYPWLMLYLRADATKGFSGGYHYDTRGMLSTLPESPNFKVRMKMEVKQGGGPKSQFYLIDMGSCWKNNGLACDGDVLTDVTRYSEMIINPQIPAWCNPTNLRNCPPYHITPPPNNTIIYRNDTARFPYSAYHYYCAPGNANPEHLESPYSTCDPYSNPQAQELVQLLPHPVWAHYGFPAQPGDGWVGDPRSWDLDVGGLSSRLYFYQDPGTLPARRIWTSLDAGTEIFVSDKVEVAEWDLSEFDVIITN